MYTKKMLSIAAVAAIMSTGALAFDTDTNGKLLSSTATAPGLYDGNRANPADANAVASRIIKNGPGEIGDALIFPAFFAGNPTDNNWESEFSVINTSNHAVIAKVVLYGRQDSVELRDFNIYLSAHDVFRAKLKDGNITSIDGSTVLPGSDNGNVVENTSDKAYVSEYKYSDNGEMVSKDNPLNIEVDGFGNQGLDDNGNVVPESSGYIAVFAMAEANNAYDHKHKELWQDYRHLIDTCRSRNELRTATHTGTYQDIEWRKGITQGLYNIQQFNKPTSVNVPDVNMSTNETDSSKPGFYVNNCKVVKSVMGGNVNFSSPTASLTGSILVSHDNSDGNGRRDLLLKAYSLDNFTDSTKNQGLLWSEGEFAHIADRCIEGYSDGKGNTLARYNKSCINNDANILRVNHTVFEYFTQDANRSALLVTQPYKRVLLEINNVSNDQIDAWKNLNAYTKKDGEFDMSMELYNDNEDHFTPVLGGFTVSPATTSTTSGIPHELSIFSPFKTIELDESQKEMYQKGYAILNFENGRSTTGLGLSAIVTQMSATVHADSQAETNWIYPYSY